MGDFQHEPDLGRRLHEESIRLQRSLSESPLPVDQPDEHPLFRAVRAVLLAFLLIGLAVVLLPPGG